jgi:hypothetical protein
LPYPNSLPPVIIDQLKIVDSNEGTYLYCALFARVAGQQGRQGSCVRCLYISRQLLSLFIEAQEKMEGSDQFENAVRP